MLADASALERFRREVLLARRVAHPNVCHVYEFYEARTAEGIGIRFLTMELLHGETLARHLRARGRMSTAEALPLALQMSQGLAAAHAEGVIHRDFKSSNVMLVQREGGSGDRGSASTRVVITDFGIARPFRNDAEEPALTGGTGMIGTPEYMAPEQVTGDPVTPATDIYALGVVLYEMVTGELPFVGNTPLVAAARRIHETPRAPHVVLPGLDRHWSHIILRCLAREPDRRFPGALEVAEALVASGRSPRRVAVGALLAVLLIAGVGVEAWRLGAFGQRRDQRWLRAEVIPEIHRLADSDHPMEAQSLAMEADAALPG